MFNIVNRRDFMLGQSVPTKREAEKARDDHDGEYVVVQVPVATIRIDDDPTEGDGWRPIVPGFPEQGVGIDEAQYPAASL
jgi:hypothetical protein